MLKPLIWGSQAPEWEEDAEDEGGLPGWQRSSQNSTASAVPKQEHPSQPASSSLRGTYDVNRKGLAGPLSVNDQQLLEPPTHRLRFTNSESFFNIASPFGPPGASNTWSLSRRDAPEHVHLLLRALMAAHDYAGAARALATLHRLHSLFDPDVYRYTVALLRLAGDHQKTSMYFRKILGKRLLAGVFAPKGGSVQGSVRGRATAHDFLAYLADRQEFDEALDISQNLLQGGSFLSHGPFKQDPSLKAHGAVLRLFVALLEHQACSSRNDTSDGSSSAADPPSPPAGDAAAATGRRRPPPLIPGLQDPLSLVGRLRACWVDCAAGAAGAAAGSRQTRALEHLRYAQRLLEQAATGSPGDASIAGYRAAATASASASESGGMPAALRQLAAFVERNPGSVKGHRLHARLLEMSRWQAQQRAAAGGDGGDGAGGDRRTLPQEEGRRDGGQGEGRDAGGGTGAQQAGADKKEAGTAEEEDQDGLLLVGVARARALRGWLEADPLEPRAALALAALHAEGSAAVVGVADRAFVVDGLVAQLETSGGGGPRPCPASAAAAAAADARGTLHTTRAATALWAALADLLGPLRVRDEPVPVVRRSGGGGGGGGRNKPTAAATPPPPPRPGTIWDHLYGADPPWAPTDFVAARGRVVGSGLADGRAGVGGALGGQAMGEGGGGDRGGLSALGSYSPHPLLRGVDAELWEETVLDPDAEPLLLAPGGGGGSRGQDVDIWCSDDEDCCSASDDDSALLQERARLASRGTGGCVYFSPPGGEDGVFQRRRKRRGDERGAARTSSRRPFLETMTVAGIVLEGMAETQATGSEEGDHARDPGATEREVEDESGGGRLRQGGGDAAAAAAAATRQSHEVAKVLVNAAGGEAEGGSSEDDEGVASRATKRRRRQGASAEQGASGGAPGSSGRGRNRSNRRHLESEDDDHEPDDDYDPNDDYDPDDDYEPEAPGVARPRPANLKLEHDDGDQDSEEEADEDYMTAPGLREAEAPLGPPTGTDAAATRLSETVSVKLPGEAAAWLLADKCCVAAHMFGPQHRYCLRAIGRLCREDVREAARPARAALRSQGFRLQLSLTRLAADNVRAEAAREGKASVAWGLPDAPPAGEHVLPFDSYVPELVGSLAAADDSSN